MVGSLSPVQIEAFTRHGYIAPLRVMAESKAAAVLAQLRASEAELGGRFIGQMNQRPYLLFPWAQRLVRDTRVLDAVESVIGADILCIGGQFFIKEAGDTAFVSWHQDGTYWGLLSGNVVTAWLALTASVPQNGCMRVIPGSHRDAVPHTETYAAANLLSRGQEVAAAVPTSEAVDISLQPGEMSLHHSLIVHGSESNQGSCPRIGFAIRYAPAQLLRHFEEDGALLVRGVRH
jgi:non-haem Fe2+, alpha-ketoglutarate-dependent halogenase